MDSNSHKVTRTELVLGLDGFERQKRVNNV